MMVLASLFRYDDGEGDADSLVITSSPEGLGSPTPGYGYIGSLTEASTLSCTAEATVTRDGVTYVCTGYTLERIDFATGKVVSTETVTDTTSYSFTYSGNHARLTWNYEPSVYAVSAASLDEAMGTVSGGGNYDADETEMITLTATPKEGYAFVRWDGLPDISLSFEEKITLPPNTYDVTAQFGPIVYASLEGTAEGDGKSWETATTVANAVTIANDGDVVIVSNGVYSAKAKTFSTLTIKKPIAIKSLTGDFNDVVFDCNSDPDNAIIISTNAILYGITCKAANGHGSGVRNITVQNKGAVVCCRSTGGYSIQWGTKGAGIFNSNGIVVDCVIDGNSYGSGGSSGVGLYQEGTLALSSRCIITNNYFGGDADSSPTAVYIKAGIIERSVIKDNFVASADLMVANRAIGVTMEGGTMINCAVVDNYCRGRSNPFLGAVLPSGTAKIINTLIEGNYYGDGVKMGYHGTASFYQSCAMTEPGEIDGGVAINESYNHYYIKDKAIPMPFAGSKLIDGGVSTDEIKTTLVDINRNPLIGDSALDIGPVEYVEGSLEIVSPVYRALDSLDATLTAKSDLNLAGAIYSWDVDSDGDVDYSGTDKAEITHTYDTLGIHTATLTVSDAQTKAVIATATQVYTVDAGTLYVNPASTTPTAPYATWDTAAHTIQMAIASATSGATVVVTNGTYKYASSSDKVSFSKPITVRSYENDTETVIINANSKCGCVYISHNKAVVSGVTITGGLQYYRQTGLHIGPGGGTATNCVMRNNTCRDSTSEGAGLWNQNGYVVDCRIYSNGGANNPVGVGVYQKGKHALIERCVIYGNMLSKAHANSCTPGVYLAGGTIRSSHIYGNYITDPSAITKVSGLAVHALSGSLVENCTIENNYYPSAANELVYGVYAATGATIRNCIIYGNGSTDGNSEYNWGGSTNAYINCYTTKASELPEGNIDADQYPNAYFNQDNVLSLPVGSSLIDKGAAVDASHTQDFNGDARTQGKTVDIGCVEYEPLPLAVSFTPETDVALDRLSTTLTVNAEGDLEGVTYSWDINGDGIVDGTGSSITLDLTTFGTHTVTVTAVNTAGNTSSFTWDFTVNPSRLYVNPKSTTPTAPYITWDTAAHMIHEAVAVAADGATVIVTNGTYKYTQNTHQINLKKPITVRSFEDDPKTVTIDANWKCTVAVIQHTGAEISGLTLTGGVANYGMAGCQLLGGGTLRNCIARGNRSGNWDGKGNGVYNQNGIVIDCVMTGNYNGGPVYGYGLYQTGEHAITDRCVITNNNQTSGNSRSETSSVVGAYVVGGLIRNTLISDNKLNMVNSKNYTMASGLYLGSGATAENCAVIGNTIYPHDGTEYAGMHTTGGTVINTLVADNNYTNGIPANVVTDAKAVWKNSCTIDASALPGENNVELTERTYRLNEDNVPVHTTKSPLYNAGIPTEATLDLIGQPRTYGHLPDIGVYELQRLPPTLMILQ